jgi:hypothetical protein
MDTNNHKNTTKTSNQTRIAQIVASFTEPMGITSRKKIEDITNESIRRLEGVLPGMEPLIESSAKYFFPDEQILAVVKEIINERIKMEQAVSSPSAVIEKKTKISEKPVPKTKTKTTQRIEFTENALAVLEKRYLQKDSTGKQMSIYGKTDSINSWPHWNFYLTPRLL